MTASRHDLIGDKHYSVSKALAISLLLAACFAFVKASFANDAIIIGGGSSALDTPAHLEASTGWIYGVLSDQSMDVVSLYNDGNESPPDSFDIKTQGPGPRTTVSALSLTFGEKDATERLYRNHRLSDVTASTRSKDIEAAISSRLAQDTDDWLLIVYTGRGVSNGADEGSAALSVWDNATIDVDQLRQWISQGKTPTRFVFSQSYSGGFHQLAYHNPSQGLQLSSPVHCGFTASSAYAKAEVGSTNRAGSDNHDYSAYFFSAISGYEFDGEIISRFADLDGDGQITLREAHLFALEEAHSIDLPLSTSEDYLLRWQPWYLRWQPASKQLPNNEYTRIFRDLASRMNLDLQGNVAQSIRVNLKTTQHQASVLRTHIGQLQADIHTHRSLLQDSAISRWPALAQPYSSGFESLVHTGQLPLINDHLKQIQPHHAELERLLEETRISERQLLYKRREATQYRKLLQLRHVALLKQQLREHGSTQNIRDYRALLECEEAPLKARAMSVNVSENDEP